MIQLKSKEEIKIMREANRIIAKTREVIIPMVKPGVSTWELDQAAEDTIRSHDAIPGFKGLYNFPATLCVAINQEVVHGIPSKDRILEEGDIIGIDMGTIVEGFYGDSAVTVAVGEVSEEATALMRVTKESLYKGIEQARPGGHLYDIGAAVSAHAQAHGYSVVKDFVGHGVGRELHEEPQVPNYGTAGTGLRLQAGMVLAIEPMINQGVADVKMLDDGWTVVTKDGMLSAHFEHSVAITEDGPQILSVL